jgi:hypothetical protein
MGAVSWAVFFYKTIKGNTKIKLVDMNNNFILERTKLKKECFKHDKSSKEKLS